MQVILRLMWLCSLFPKFMLKSVVMWTVLVIITVWKQNAFRLL